MPPGRAAAVELEPGFAGTGAALAPAVGAEFAGACSVGAGAGAVCGCAAGFGGYLLADGAEGSGWDESCARSAAEKAPSRSRMKNLFIRN